MQFYFPTEFGEQLAFLGASLAAFLGLVIMFAPGLTMRFFGLQVRDDRNEGFLVFRVAGGMMLGLGMSALLLAQPMVYLALGSTFAIGLFGLVLSLLQDHSASFRTLPALIVFMMLVALPLVYVFGLV